MSLGKRIKDRREDTDRDVAGLAAHARVSVSAVYQWEAGDTEPTGPNLVLIAEYLRTTERWLAFGTGSRDRQNGVTLTETEATLLSYFHALPEDVRTAQFITMKHLAAQHKKTGDA